MYKTEVCGGRFQLWAGSQGLLVQLAPAETIESHHPQVTKSGVAGVSLMDLERLVLAVSVLFSRRVGSEDQTEVDRRCENIAR